MKKTYLIFLLLLTSCSYKALPPITHPIVKPIVTPIAHPIMTFKRLISNYNDVFIMQDTLWSGSVEIKGTVTVMKGITLTIAPGTIIKFAAVENINEKKESAESADTHEMGNGIIVEGQIIANGTKEKNITFTSMSKNPKPSDWGKILIKYSKDNIFNYCKFEYAEHAIHSHFSTAEITNCVFSNNIEGMRLGMSSIIINNNLITSNTSRGINFRNCKNIIKFNEITNNNIGIFLYEKNSKSNISFNNIYNNNSFNIQLGEFHKDDITLNENWFGDTDLTNIYKTIYDKEDDSILGKVFIKTSNKKIDKTGVQ